MSIILFTDSGKAAVIELEKEIEVSASKAALVTVEFVFEAKAATNVEVFVNKELVATINPGEAPKVGNSATTFEVAAGQKYEVKKATLLKEAKASVALEQNTIASADVETLLDEGRAAAVTASAKANQELADDNASILGLGLRFRGAYDETVTYAPNDVVTETGKSYIFIAASLNEPTATDEVEEGTAVERGKV
jgi:hypothetical protein